MLLLNSTFIEGLVTHKYSIKLYGKSIEKERIIFHIKRIQLNYILHRKHIFLYTILLLGFISTQCLIDMTPITD
jgi:hypothetical protein